MPSLSVPILFDADVAVISGAGQGLGEAFARAFAKAGCRVVALDVKAEPVQAVATAIRAEGGRCDAFALDVRDRQACHAMAEGFTKALVKAGWAVTGALHQTRIFSDVVSERPRPVAYFLVDAMRFEMGIELADGLDQAS